MKTTVKSLFFVIFSLIFIVKIGAQNLPDSVQAKANDSTQTEKAIGGTDQTRLQHVFPNPFQDQLTINFPIELCGKMIVRIQIYDLFTGKCILEKSFENRLDIETLTWREGMYAIRINHDRGYEPAKVYHKK